VVGGSTYARAALESEIGMVKSAPNGRRTPTLFHAAIVGGELIASRQVDRATVESALLIVAGARNVGDAERQIRRGIERGMRHPRNPRRTAGRFITTRGEARQVVFEWSEQLDATGTDRRICMAIASHCWSVGSTTIDLSFREVAEAAGVSRTTVARRAGGLARWVRIVRGGQRFRKQDTRTRWRIVLRDGVSKRDRPKAFPSGVGGLSRNETHPSDPSANVWDRWSSGWAAWQALDLEDSTTATFLIAVTGYSRPTIYRNLRRLEDLGLARRTEAGWVRVDVELGPADFSLREFRRRQHERERGLHARFLEARYASREVSA